MKNVLITSTALLGLCCGCGAMPETSTEKQPNLIIVFPDQMRGTAIGALGVEPVQTPRLDRFMTESLMLTDAASNYPVCSPYRAMLMSAKYAFSNGVWGNCNSATAPYQCELPTNTVCWSDVLAANGYDLGYIGKWHLDAPHKPYVNTGNNRGRVAWNEWCPPERRHGFGYWYAYGTFDNHLNPMYWATDSARDDFRHVKEYGPKHEVDRAIEFLDNHNNVRDTDKPFAMVISMNPPHTGYECVPQKYYDMYADLDLESIAERFGNVPPKGSPNGKFFRESLRWYYAQCTAVDEQFGRLLDHLKARGLDDNTIVLFTSDHGDMMGMHGRQGKNVAYEESMHVPFMIRWPAKLEPRKDNLLISTPDIAPTLLGMMGLSQKFPAEWEGIDYSRALTDGKGRRPEGQLYIHLTEGWGDAPDTGFRFGRRGWRDHEWTYVLTRKAGKVDQEELFNRKSDPAQNKDVAKDNPAVIKRLKAKMDAELRRVNPAWKTDL